jgi:hypothetical protein
VTAYNPFLLYPAHWTVNPVAGHPTHDRQHDHFTTTGKVIDHQEEHPVAWSPHPLLDIDHTQVLNPTPSVVVIVPAQLGTGHSRFRSGKVKISLQRFSKTGQRGTVQTGYWLIPRGSTHSPANPRLAYHTLTKGTRLGGRFCCCISR